MKVSKFYGHGINKGFLFLAMIPSIGSREFPMNNNGSATRNFDLNIEKILESWEVCHAVRELIANALDEQVLSSTADIQISRDAQGTWHIRDFGRGLQYENLTQNENEEKLLQPGKVIGRFGVGLKDALATLNRRGIEVQLRSQYCDITLQQTSKHGFSDVVTLHAVVAPPTEPDMVGTDISLIGIAEDDIAAAKDFFLYFSGEAVLDPTPYGQVLQRDPSRTARIFVMGILVAEEANFAFSYNITSLTAPMRKALNRERTHVGRTAYTDRVKTMLLSSNAAAVADTLASELVKIESGTHCDEVQWTDVAAHACQILNASRRVVFITASELVISRDAVDQAIADGYQVVTVPDNIRRPLMGMNDALGNPVRDLTVFQQEQAERFKFAFISVEQLNRAEREIFNAWPWIASLAGGLPTPVHEILISEQLCPDLLNGSQTQGLWEPTQGRIIIKRSQLVSLASFTGTLLHEITHARTGYADVTREFETALTNLLGKVATDQTISKQAAITKHPSFWQRLFGR